MRLGVSTMRAVQRREEEARERDRRVDDARRATARGGGARARPACQSPPLLDPGGRVTHCAEYSASPSLSISSNCVSR